MEKGFQTDRGRIRSHNEDSGGLFERGDGCLLAVVADGMGGHQAGDVASALALSVVRREWEKEETRLETTDDAVGWLCRVVAMTNKEIMSHAESHPECKGMGTTVVLAVCTRDFAVVAHVGDSRGYWLCRDELRRVTNDHSLVYELVRQGQISAQEAETHPRKNVLMQALGTEGEVNIETHVLEWQTDDVLMLCSDGLTNHVSDETIHEVLASGEPLQTQADEFIRLANSAGGDDNITLTLVRNAETADELQEEKVRSSTNEEDQNAEGERRDKAGDAG
ncbi:MAG TPA: Stp1/IreP family PP2C-type Ser/Thr phosphatase [Bacillales bacterium]|nr:Stp1/IreP family PP2C-type Ser/Thr phosphatase [Bacillales bacterium]